MPELPEVENAAARARRSVRGRTITRVRVLHPAFRRRLSPAAARSLAGEGITAVSRHAKTQFLCLTSGRTLQVHFRMTGDWAALPAGAPLPPHARLAIDFDDGSRLALDDSRALAVVTLHAGPPPSPAAPDALDPVFDARWLGTVLAGRRAPVKAALLDQGVAAGVGNIYACEALWRARIDPRTPAHRLGRIRLTRLVRAIRGVLREGLRRHARYYGAPDAPAARFAVYDRDGERCRRCGGRIRRVVLRSRGTWFCPSCQTP